MYGCFKKIGSADHTLEWKSKGLSTTSNNSLTPKLSYFGNKTGVKFNRICLNKIKLHILMEK